jgi:hypothetical protein
VDPDLARAADELAARGIVPGERAAALRRIYDDRLISVLAELRVLLYGGVLLVAAGAGLLVKENFARIGPLAVAVALGAAVVAGFVWLVRTAPPFDRGKVEPPSLAFDYVALLTVLLAGTDLAFVEAQLEALGPNWPWHFLLMAAVAAAASIRFDSRTLFSLALSSFAAWRGFSTAQLERALWRGLDDSVQLNALACGALFVMLAVELRRKNFKQHFAPVARHLGWLLILATALTGTLLSGWRADLYLVLSIACGVVLVARSYGRRDFPFFAYGVLALYLSFVSTLARTEPGLVLGSFLLVAGTVAVVVALRKVQRRMHEAR